MCAFVAKQKSIVYDRINNMKHIDSQLKRLAYQKMYNVLVKLKTH